MGYIATDLATIPMGDYTWYVFLLNEDWEDDASRAVSRHFENFARDVGRDILVVKGAEPRHFYHQMVELYGLRERGAINTTIYDPLGDEIPFPAILVADRIPEYIEEVYDPQEFDKLKIMVFPVGGDFVRSEDVGQFMKYLSDTLRLTDDFSILTRPYFKGVKAHWMWLTQFMAQPPNFLGCGRPFNEILSTFFKGRKRQLPPKDVVKFTRLTQDSYKYDVALSFAGEDRVYVEDVAAQLRQSGVRVFYDRYEQSDLWGKDLYQHLDDIYRKKSRFCIMFISAHYAEKLWSNHERKSAQARLLESAVEYILPVRFDSTEVPGMPPTIGHIDANDTNSTALVRLIVEKLNRA